MSVMSRCRRRTSGASSRKGGKTTSTPVCTIPAAFTRMSTLPAASTSANACRRSLRSAMCAVTSAPSARSSLARVSMRSVVDVIATRAPRRASRRAEAKPIPDSLPQPVTRAARPAKSKGLRTMCTTGRCYPRTERRPELRVGELARWDVGELVGIEDRSHSDHDTVGDLERRHPECASAGLIEDEARLAVDERRPMCEFMLASLAAPTDERFRHALGADERHRDSRRLAASVAVNGRVRGEELDERRRVALLPRAEEAAGHFVSFLARDVKAAPSLGNMLVRTGQDLPAVVGGLVDDPSDVVVGVIKDLAEQENGA